jgi:uncharacterized membrane protein YedE/YeeE
MSQGKNKKKLFAISFSMSLLMGIYFGIVLMKSEVALFQRVHAMFRFEEPHMFLIIGVGIGVAMVSLMILRKLRAKSLTGRELIYKPKAFSKGTVIGGVCFGAGWAITGSCPGPIYAQIGAGIWPAFITLGGALVGMYLFALWNERLESRSAPIHGASESLDTPQRQTV